MTSVPMPGPYVVRGSNKPETRDAGHGYYYDAPPPLLSGGPFPTHLEMIDHATASFKGLVWRWFVLGYDHN